MTILPGIHQTFSLKTETGNSLEVQWLRLHASNAGGTVSIPGWGTEIPHGVWHSQKNHKQTHGYREQTSGYQWGERSGEGYDRGRGLRGTNCNV